MTTSERYEMNELLLDLARAARAAGNGGSLLAFKHRLNGVNEVLFEKKLEQNADDEMSNAALSKHVQQIWDRLIALEGAALDLRITRLEKAAEEKGKRG